MKMAKTNIKKPQNIYLNGTIFNQILFEIIDTDKNTLISNRKHIGLRKCQNVNLLRMSVSHLNRRKS